ncbi:MAG: DMT family transporter [Planctomycetota bacterium]
MRYYAAIVITIMLYSTVEVVSKFVTHVDPNLLAFLRFFPAGVIILAIGRKQFRRVSVRDAAGLAALGLIGVTFTFAAYHEGLTLEHLKASTAATIFSVNPVFTSLAAVFLLGERLTGRRLAGVLLGVAGIYVVGFGFEPVRFATAKGPLLMAAAQVTFGIYVAGGKKYVACYGPFFVNGVIFVVGSIFFLPMISEWSVAGMSAPTVLWVVYLSLFATGLAYVLYLYGLNEVPTAAGTSIFYLKPVLASILAVLALGETLRLHFFLGLAVIFGSLTLTLRRGGAQPTPPEPAEDQHPVGARDA